MEFPVISDIGRPSDDSYEMVLNFRAAARRNATASLISSKCFSISIERGDDVCEVRRFLVPANNARIIAIDKHPAAARVATRIEIDREDNEDCMISYRLSIIPNTFKILSF